MLCQGAPIRAIEAEAHERVWRSTAIPPTAMETFRYPQFPKDLANVYVALFTDVQNAADLKKRLVAASVMPGAEGDIEREAVNFAFVDARLVRTYTHRSTIVLTHITCI